MRALFYSDDAREKLTSTEVDYCILEDREEDIFKKNLSFRGFNVIENESAEKEIYRVFDIETGTAISLIEQATFSGVLDLRMFNVV